MCIKEIYYIIIYCTVMEAEQSQGLQSASCTLSRTKGIGYILFKSQQAQDPGKADVSGWVWRQEKMMSWPRAGRVPSYRWEDQHFCSIQFFNWLYEAHQIREDICFTHFTYSDVNFIQKPPHRHIQNHVC